MHQFFESFIYRWVLKSSAGSILSYTSICSRLDCFSSGSDGLLKLWDVKTSTCVKSIDAHEGKIWGMAASTDENLLVTCASDSSVTIWRVSLFNHQFHYRMFLSGFYRRGERSET